MKDFNKVLKHLSNKQWLLRDDWKEKINFLKSSLKKEKNIDTIRAIKNYTKIFKQPLTFKHDLTTIKTGRVYAKYTLLPNKPILNIYLKELIIPRENYIFVSFDFKASQIKHLVVYKDLKDLKDLINSGKDIYEEFAKELNITRKEAKICILLLSYGGNENTIKKEMPLLDSKQILEKYNKWFEIKNPTYIEKVKLNHIIQKKEVEFFKMKLCKIYKNQDHRFQLHAFIHDEIILEMHKEHLYMIDIIKEYLEKYKKIKMEVDVKTSETFQFK